jgi:hypothetical protein
MDCTAREEAPALPPLAKGLVAEGFEGPLD